MSNETLTTVLIVLLSVNFILWIGFLVFLFLQIRKLFKSANEIVHDVQKMSTSLLGTAMKVGTVAFGVLKGFQTVKSITTLGDIFERDVSEDGKEE